MQKLKTFRILCGLSQQEMAKALDVDRSTYSQKENGHIDFTTSQVNKILKIFEEKGHKTTYEDLFMDK